MILSDFDECKTSTFNPDEAQKIIPNFPKIGVTCFSKKLIDKVLETYESEVIAFVGNANGKDPIYKINYKGQEIAFFMSKVGASACVMQYEETIAMGLEKLIMVGTCGVLDKSIDDLEIIIPTAAIRDEGTSYHYMKVTDEISVNEKYKKEFEGVISKHNYSFIEGKVWTTDAIYRETRNKVLKRKKQGCICVDMECSAMSVVSKFRNRDFFQFFYAADNLDGDKWDQRSLECSENLTEKEKIVLLAFELAHKIKDK